MGKVLTSVNAAGNKTSYQYEDASNDLLCTGTTTKVYHQMVTDSGKVNFTSEEVTTKTQYDSNENVTMEKDETGQVTQTTYGTGAELIVEKTLSGRALKAGEFTFKIEAADSDTVNAETADAKLSDSDREFTNTSGAADGVASRIFDKLSG